MPRPNIPLPSAGGVYVIEKPGAKPQRKAFTRQPGEAEDTAAKSPPAPQAKRSGGDESGNETA